MHVIQAVNVRDALPQAVEYMLKRGVKEETRLGSALTATEPVTICYTDPKQHVLLSPVRDANPFFHLMEAMWMLAGRQDSAFLDHYIKDFGARFGKHGIIMDAYGYRWRHGLRVDQLDEIVAQLRKEPTTRQCVLQMWGAGRDDLMAYSSKPCNLVATFRIVSESLDMTVFNRSNDLIWGCCGANAVHFAILQEYIAARVGIEIGAYWQVTTNLHLYLDHIHMMNKRAEGEISGDDLKDTDNYEDTQPLMTSPLLFDEELRDTVGWIDDIHENQEIYTGNLTNEFLRDVVLPMAIAHQRYKNGDQSGALRSIENVTAQDWRRAGKEWLGRRG